MERNKAINLTFFESQDMYRWLIEAVHVGIFISDESGRLLYVNHAFVKILGYDSKDQVIGNSIGSLLFPSERVLDSFF